MPEAAESDMLSDAGGEGGSRGGEDGRGGDRREDGEDGLGGVKEFDLLLGTETPLIAADLYIKTKEHGVPNFIEGGPKRFNLDSDTT